MRMITGLTITSLTISLTTRRASNHGPYKSWLHVTLPFVPTHLSNVLSLCFSNAPVTFFNDFINPSIFSCISSTLFLSIEDALFILPSWVRVMGVRFMGVRVYGRKKG